MSPQLALLFALAFIFYLFLRDLREEPRPSAALWIPTLWLLINGSRQVSQWLGAEVGFSADRLEDGSTTDKLVYGVLIVASISVLLRRKWDLEHAIRRNPAIWAFFVYAGVSILWSDYPLISFKRWVKALGDVLMVMVVASDPFPRRAIEATLKRCAYVLIPISVLFCKYYEHLGRAFDAWGNSFYTGVTTDKNMLGYLLFAFGLFFAAEFIAGGSLHREVRPRWSRWSDRLIQLMFLIMIGWLMLLADSQTAFMSLLVGVAVLLGSRLTVVRRHFVLCSAIMLITAVFVEMSFSISANLIEGAGRDVTFTGRTGLWQTVLSEPVNPLIGTGYASFWLGERLLRYWAMYPTSPPIQAHNGYIEMYLNQGLIGLGLLTCLLVAGFIRVRRDLAALSPASAGRHDGTVCLFGLAYGIAYLFYNITEATFQGLNLLFVIFLMLTIRYPQPEVRRSVARDVVIEKLRVPAKSGRERRPRRRVV
jgi:O-antigen ligase